MTIEVMLGQSAMLTLLGMGIVFGFLVVMIIAVTIVGKLVHALRLDKDLDAQPPASSSGAAKAGAVTAAITAAVTEYRKR